MSGWSVVVPVKSWRSAKSRLVEVPAEDRRALAIALAGDTVETVLGTPGVRECLLVGEAETCSDLAGSGARCVTAPDAGVDAAFRAGAAAARRSALGTCYLMADLPHLRSAALHDALALVTGTTAVVRDAAGTGTVLLAARGSRPAPAFGPGSGRRHLAMGARDLTAQVDQGLRHDLDVWADLEGLDRAPGPRLARWLRSSPGRLPEVPGRRWSVGEDVDDPLTASA